MHKIWRRNKVNKFKKKLKVLKNFRGGLNHSLYLFKIFHFIVKIFVAPQKINKIILIISLRKSYKNIILLKIMDENS